MTGDQRDPLVVGGLSVARVRQADLQWLASLLQNKNFIDSIYENKRARV